MKANVVSGGFKKAYPITYWHAIVHYAQLTRPDSINFRTLKTLAEQLGYVYNIDHYFNGNHGIFTLAIGSRPSTPEIYVTPEMLYAYTSLGLTLIQPTEEEEEEEEEEKEQEKRPKDTFPALEENYLYPSKEDKHVRGPYILYYGKVFQTVLPVSRQGVISIGNWVVSKGKIPTAFVIRIGNNVLKTPDVVTIHIIDVLKTRIKDYVGIKKVSQIRPVHLLPFRAYYGDRDALISNSFNVLGLLAGLNDQVIITMNHPKALIAGFPYARMIAFPFGFYSLADDNFDSISIITHQSTQIVEPFVSSKVVDVGFLWDRVEGFTIKDINSVVSNNYTTLVNPDAKINAIDIDLALRYSRIVNSPEYRYWSANRFKIQYFEDETADVESVEFVSSGKLYETDFYVNNLKGGTGSFYGTNIVSGWNTISRRQSGQTVQVGRETEGNNLIAHMPYAESVGILTDKTLLAYLLYNAGAEIIENLKTAELPEEKSVTTQDKPFILNSEKLNQASFEGFDEKLIFSSQKRSALSFGTDDTLINSAELPDLSSFSSLSSKGIYASELGDSASFNVIDGQIKTSSLWEIPSSYTLELTDTTLVNLLNTRTKALRYKEDVFENTPRTRTFDALRENKPYFESTKTPNLLSVREQSPFVLAVESKYTIDALWESDYYKSPVYLFSTNSIALTDPCKSNAPANSIIEHPELIGGVYPEEEEEGEEQQETYLAEGVTRFEPLWHSKAVDYIDRWYPYYGTEEDFLNGTSSPVPEDELTKKFFGAEPHYGFTWVHNFLNRITISGYVARPQLTLMQIGYGYTSEPNVVINAAKVKEVMPDLPGFFVWDAQSDEFFDSPQIDTRDYLGPIVDRAKAEIRKFVEWIEEEGTQILFVYGLTYHFHIINGMQFNEQSFMGCARKALKIIGKMPHLP